MLTPEQLLQSVHNLHYFDGLSIDDGRVRFVRGFSVCEGGDPVKRARTVIIDIALELRLCGLRAVDVIALSDSVWGVIEQADA